jgi:hypothetical protein
MTERELRRKLMRQYLRTIDHLVKKAYEEGVEAGIIRARGQGRRGRTIREDATVAGLAELIVRHFGLERYGFEVRVVHASGRRVPLADQLRKYRLPES